MSKNKAISIKIAFIVLSSIFSILLLAVDKLFLIPAALFLILTGYITRIVEEHSENENTRRIG